MTIEIRHISKHFGGYTALDDVSLHVPSGELVALLGPSGSGKTTLLRIVAGLELQDDTGGTILFDGEDVASRSAAERRVGFVFQHYALFKHMSVFENVAFGLRVLPRKRRPHREAIQAKVRELLSLVQLDGVAERYPSQLSGGQRQRVALARSLAVEPRMLLLDEPFGALDARVRLELRRWLRRLHDEIHLTSLFVTHDQEEALEVADRIVLMNHGKIEQTGTPEEVFHRPSTEFVLNFLGQVNLFRGRIEGGEAHIGAAAGGVAGSSPPGGEARVFVRPHDFDVDLAPRSKASFRARVRRINAAGAIAKLEVTSEVGDTVLVELPQEVYRALRLAVGAEVFLTPREVKVFTEDYSI